MTSPSHIRSVLDSPRALPLFDVAGARTVEAHCLASRATHELMARAGRAVADLALALAPHARCIHVLAGPGNNGGDGLEAAMHLHRARKEVAVTLIGQANRPSDASQALRTAVAAGVRISHTIDAAAVQRSDLLIDALLGIGLTRRVDGELAELIQLTHARDGLCLAVDVPSGLDADTGNPASGGPCVRADHTLSLLTLKPGLFTGAGRDWCGRIWWDDLGCTEPHTGVACLLGRDALSIPSRRHAQHKGSFGTVVVAGGAPGMEGAATLAARSALAAGAGRVYRVNLPGATPTPSEAWPELMHTTLEDAARRSADAVLVCGCGGGSVMASVLPRLLSVSTRMVLDADGLNAVASDERLVTMLQARASRGLTTVLTPHPQEAARLLGTTVADVQHDRLLAAQTLTRRFGCVVVLKGSGTVITAAGQVPAINPTGDARLATAGSGDVLAGWIGGRWAQDEGASAFQAACRAVFSHGWQAEQTAAPLGVLRASRLIEG